MRRLTPVLFLVALTVACDDRPPTEFYLLRSGGTKAQIVDFGSIRTDAGIRRVTVIGLAAGTITTRNSRKGQYGHLHVAFDCRNRLYRGEGVTVYGSDFSKVDDAREVSPWREITGSQQLMQDFERFCAPEPLRSDLMKLPGATWADAAKAARGFLEVPPQAFTNRHTKA